MKSLHVPARDFAATHFLVSLILGLTIAYFSFGAGLSDVLKDAPAWFEALVGLLWVLQTPVVAYESFVLRHSKHSADMFLLCLLAALWSIALGYIQMAAVRHLKRRQ